MVLLRGGGVGVRLSYFNLKTNHLSVCWAPATLLQLLILKSTILKDNLGIRDVIDKDILCPLDLEYQQMQIIMLIVNTSKNKIMCNTIKISEKKYLVVAMIDIFYKFIRI